MNKELIEELTLLLMYLTSWEENAYVDDENGKIKEATIKTCWKGYDFDILNELTIKGYLFYSKYSNKSVSLTEEGEELAKKIMTKYIK